MIPAVSFVGWSNSGKTTFLGDVIKELKARGLTVAVVKNTCHKMEPDVSGKDTWNFAKSGADLVILNGPTVFMRQEKVDTRKEIASVLESITGADIILLEGVGDPEVPKVEIWRDACGQGNRFAPEEIMAMVTEDAPAVPYRGLPLFKRHEIRDFVDFLLRKTGLQGR